MENAINLEKIFSGIINDYINEYDIKEFIKPEYRLTDDLERSYLEICPDTDSSLVVGLNKFNGYMIPPRNSDNGQYIVLLNATKMIENMQAGKLDWVGTIVHETTHVQDFNEFINSSENVTYEDLLNSRDYSMFSLWTEINARARGHFFVRKYTQGDAMNGQEALTNLIEQEIPYQMNQLFEQYHATNDGYEQAYVFAQYIGRLYALKKVFPDVITKHWVREHFGVNSWAADWFDFFCEFDNLSMALNNFDEMKSILKRNFIFK